MNETSGAGQNKIAIVTTFPQDQHYGYAMLESLAQYWPKEWLKLVYFEKPIDVETESLIHEIGVRHSTQILIGNNPSREHVEFLAKIPDDNTKDYRKQAKRFCHKVFAQAEAADKIEGIDYLIWMDADIITSKPVTTITPWVKEGAVASYMGRKDWNTSETGLIIYNLNNGGKDFIRNLVNYYTTGKIIGLEEQTDAYVFDLVRAKFNEENGRDVFFNISKGVEGRDVFDKCPFGEFMTHYKGNLKKDILPLNAQHSNTMSGNTFDVGNMGIRTKNCVQNTQIQKHVAGNIRLIEEWLMPCKPNNEEIAICSAGPSLKSTIHEIRKLYDRGVKVVAVKHALETLVNHGIKPWACILLDPRPHVADFVQYPDLDVNWFVASMVDPAVTHHLMSTHAKVYGYHAAVGARECDVLPASHKGGKHIVIEGGSATATRGISLLYILGFRHMHLFGYDNCYHERPDLQERKDNGKLRYEEVTLEVETAGGGKAKRTFWTEGQFLAQVQEMRLSYLQNEDLALYTYGDGIIPWMHKHMAAHKEWVEWDKQEQKNVFLDSEFEINEWLDGRAGKSSGKTG